MEITWHGLGCFTVKGDTGTLLVDPYKGVTPPSKINAILLTGTGADELPDLGDISDVKVFDWPGEFEAAGIAVKSIPLIEGKKEQFRLGVFEVDGIRFCHLGMLADKLDDELVEQIGDIDVLLVPVGGEGTMDGKMAHAMVEKIDPRVVIPMYFASGSTGEKFADVSKFLKEVGQTAAEPIKKYKNVRSKLPVDQTEFVVLEAV